MVSMNATKHLEVVTYTYGDVAVHVKIDYDQGTIGLVEKESGSQPTRYSRKQWVFAERNIEYMASWKNILAAMTHAITEATKELKAHQDAAENKKIDLMIRVAEYDAKDGKKRK